MMTISSASDRRRAFVSAPDPRRYFPALASEDARHRIVRSIARNEGPALMIGAIGAGKSMLLAVLAEQFSPMMSVVTLPGAQLCTRRALLQMILCELGLPYRGADEGDLRLSILEHLRGVGTTPANKAESGGRGRCPDMSPRAGAPSPKPRRMLVLVDEADSLPVRLLEELRVLTNVVAEGIPLVSLVLAGTPILEERFADPLLEKFSQRISCRCYLAPLGRDETLQYVRSQVAATGVDPNEWFDASALTAIHAATAGLPRLINQLGDQLEWLIEETGCQPLDAALVQQAWSDLQQLPAPWNTDFQGTSTVGPSEVSVVEFGELDGGDAAAMAAGASPDDDEQDDESPASIPFARGRSRRRSVDAGSLIDIVAKGETTAQIEDRLDRAEALALSADSPDGDGDPMPVPREADNPFSEPFEEEEIIVDPYAGVEIHSTASRRHFERSIGRPARPIPSPLGASKNADVPFGWVGGPSSASPSTGNAGRTQIPTPAGGELPRDLAAFMSPAVSRGIGDFGADLSALGEVLLIDDDVQPSAELVAGRQFRRLFRILESGGPKSLSG